MAEIADTYRGTKEYYLVYSELINAARYRGLTTYQAVARIMGLPLSGSHMGKEVGQLLGEISENEIENGRPMLSALCVGVSGVPGEGFYGWARKLGRLKDDSNEGEQHWWRREIEVVYAAWKPTYKE